jgi:hypothetical protein
MRRIKLKRPYIRRIKGRKHLVRGHRQRYNTRLPKRMLGIPDASQKFRVVFDDGREIQSDRFTIATTVGRYIKDIHENADGTIDYTGESYKFKAYPIDNQKS